MSDYNPRQVAESFSEAELRTKREEYRRRADRMREFREWIEFLHRENFGEQDMWPEWVKACMADLNDAAIDMAEWYESVQWEIEDRME